jgi:MFS family permease
VSGFNVILPTLLVKLDIPQAGAVWPAGAFALVTAAFLLPFGRLADKYGAYPIFILGLMWFCVWSVIAGFAINELMLDFCRALQGLGPSAFLPSGVSLMSNMYRPGPRKNLVFSLYGGSAPLGFFFGIFIAGLTGQFLRFGWYFWIGAILLFTTTIAAILTVPNDFQEDKKMRVEMDWLGTALIVSGLILVVFAITDSAGAPNQWKTPYVYILLVIGSLLLGLAAYVEGYVTKNPLLPFDLFSIPYIKPLFIALFFSYGCLGIFLLYGTLYMQDIMGATPLQVSAWFSPMCVGGILVSILGGYVLHLIPGTMLVIVAGLGWTVPSVLFAVAPIGANYWAYVFPSMVCATIGIDITFNVVNIFITTNLSSKRQGLAGALINSLLYLGIAFLLAFADFIQTETAGRGLKRSYQNVFWYQLACAATALVILAGFVRLRKAESDLTMDEREALAAESTPVLFRAKTS